ncbi:MAG: transcriptional regulator [Acidimicrobiales bacterium]
MCDRNGLLLAAGYAPLYARGPLDGPELARVDAALGSMLAHHEPYPAMVMNRRWDVLRADQGAQNLFGRLVAPDPLPDPANVLRLMIEPGPVRDHVVNWTSVVPALLERARREAIGGILGTQTAALVDQLQARPDVATLLVEPDATTPTAPVLDVRFAIDGTTLSFFSVVSTLGTPIDITAQELRVEAFFPSDEPTRHTWPALNAARPAAETDRRLAMQPAPSQRAVPGRTTQRRHPADVSRRDPAAPGT